MLRKLNLNEPYRSLGVGFWSDDVPFGRRTVIYGHNGSGKSTLSDLLLGVADGNAPIDLVWIDESRAKHRVRRAGSGPSPAMAVFTRAWVQRNLAQFLEGDTAQAIVTLGSEAIDARADEERLEKEVAGHKQEAVEEAATLAELENTLERVVRGVQDSIVATLRPIDATRFTKARYSAPVVRGRLADFDAATPDEAEQTAALASLRGGAPKRLQEIVLAPEAPQDLVSQLPDLLRDTPSRVALAALDGNAEGQRWAERGLALHVDADQCLFCDSSLTGARKEDLARHFDDSWKLIKSQAIAARDGWSTFTAAVQRWRAELPSEGLVAAFLRPGYTAALGSVDDAWLRIREVIDEIQRALAAKTEDPGSAPVVPDLSALTTPLPTEGVAKLVDEHNAMVAKHTELVEQNYEAILNHLIGSRSDEFRDIERQRDQAAARRDAANVARAAAERGLEIARQKKFSSNAMAETLSKDLARVYGKNHISVEVATDGKSYKCRRGDEPARHLSEGERTTLSLLYFLRKLEDESIRTPANERIVVIDDPTSSLDRESIFATHQWLAEVLTDFGQVIVLTHDFNLLRLLLLSQKRQWGKALAEIKKSNPTEELFPRATFLEMHASGANGSRSSALMPLPELLRDSVSEYAFLFASVMKGIANPSDHERLFLLPNAARRVLEAFAAYKAPNLFKIDQQLREIAPADSKEEYRDVYDFCNRFSHGEGREILDVLDARTVLNQLKRCMTFLRDADTEHFERLCKAVKVDGAVVA